MHNCFGRRLPFTVDTLETSESNAHFHPSGSAARLLKNSQNRYEYNAFTLFTHSLARVLAPWPASVCAQLPPPIPIQVAQWPCSNWKLNSFRVEIESAWICMSVCTLMQKFKCAWLNCCCCYCECCHIEYPTCHNRITSCTPMSNSGGTYSPLPSVLNQATLALNMAAIELGSSCQLSFWAASVKKKPSTSEWSKIWLYPWILASHSSHIKCWCAWVLLPQHSKGQPSTLRRFCFRLGVVKNVWTVLSLSFNGNSDAEVASKLPATDRERKREQAGELPLFVLFLRLCAATLAVK